MNRTTGTLSRSERISRRLDQYHHTGVSIDATVPRYLSTLSRHSHYTPRYIYVACFRPPQAVTLFLSFCSGHQSRPRPIRTIASPACRSLRLSIPDVLRYRPGDPLRPRDLPIPSGASLHGCGELPIWHSSQRIYSRHSISI